MRRGAAQDTDAIRRLLRQFRCLVRLRHGGEFVIGSAVFVRELSSLLGPESLARRLTSAPGFAWLDSDGSQGAEGRFSFFGAGPVEWRRAAAGDFAALQGLGVPDGSAGAADGGGIAEDAATGDSDSGSEADGGGRRPPGRAQPALSTRSQTSMEPAAPLDPSLVPGWIGYVAYDSPGLCFARYSAVLVYDHHSGRNFVAGDDPAACERLLALAGLEPDGRADPSWKPRNAVGGSADAPRGHEHESFAAPAAGAGHSHEPVVSAADPAEHARAIAAAQTLIARGELYQVNLARKLTAAHEGHPLALALAMRAESPVPLGMYFDDGERAVVARSMERFLRWKLPERLLHTRPIKGTRPREGGADSAEDRQALATDPKEHAEHAMIVDLMRNDLGRVAAVGSVEVVERFAVEPFARLHHLVSTIACTTRPEVDLRDILSATFPPGSVTGAPKIRAIEAIAALEPTPRGIYTGAVGFIDRTGGLSLAVAIRTAVVERGVATYFAGGGIVEASDTAREIAETDLKARVFTDAVEAVRAGGFEPP